MGFPPAAESACCKAVTGFGNYLLALLSKSEQTQASLARAARTTQVRVSEVVKGKRAVPFGQMEAWADALGLKGSEREEFLDRVALSHAHERVQRLVERLQKR